MGRTRILDCDTGRRLGCETFCCRLIVRLRPGERDPGAPDREDKSCVDKDPEDGLCVHLDRGSWRCRVWAQRPALCREYDCNTDPLLQIVLRDGFRSLGELVTAPPGCRSALVRIPPGEGDANPP